MVEVKLKCPVCKEEMAIDINEDYDKYDALMNHMAIFHPQDSDEDDD